MLVESLRTWGGSHAQAPVYAFAPRPGFRPEPRRSSGWRARRAASSTSRWSTASPTSRPTTRCRSAPGPSASSTTRRSSSPTPTASSSASRRSSPGATGSRRCARWTGGSPARAARARASPTGARCTPSSGSRASPSCAPPSARWRSAPTGTAASIAARRSAGLFGGVGARRSTGSTTPTSSTTWPQFMDQISLADCHRRRPRPGADPLRRLQLPAAPPRLAHARRDGPRPRRHRPRPLPALAPHARRPRRGEPPVRPGDRPVCLARRAPAARADGRGRRGSPPGRSSRASTSAADLGVAGVERWASSSAAWASALSPASTSMRADSRRRR